MRIAKALQVLEVPIESVKFDPKNVRIHNEKNVRAIRASLEAHGQQTPIVVDGEGFVLKGNGTLTAALELGAKTIAAVRFDGENGRLYAIDDNRSGELAEWDWQELAEQLKQWQTQDVDVDLLAHGWEDWELGPLLEATWEPPAVSSAGSGGGDGEVNELQARPIALTVRQRERFDQVAEAIRGQEGKAKLSDGEVVVALCEGQP